MKLIECQRGLCVSETLISIYSLYKNSMLHVYKCAIKTICMITVNNMNMSEVGAAQLFCQVSSVAGDTLR